MLAAAPTSSAAAPITVSDMAPAHADAAKACDLGVNEGCARAKQVAPR